jgi:hypothetical protein
MEEIQNYDVLIDDSGWGNPLGGVIIGLYKFDLRVFTSRIIAPNYFQVPNYQQKKYLPQIALKSLEMINEFNVGKTERILVCRGYCNSYTPKLLISNGFTNVETGVVGEPLQTWIEEKYKEYLYSIGFNGYSDPKNLDKKTISRGFYDTVKWAIENNKLDFCKTGWDYFLNDKRFKLKFEVSEQPKRKKRPRIKKI